MPTILPSITSSLLASVCGADAQPPIDLGALQRECRELDRSAGWGAGSGHLAFGRRADVAAAHCWADFNAASGLQAKGVTVNPPRPIREQRGRYRSY